MHLTPFNSPGYSRFFLSIGKRLGPFLLFTLLGILFCAFIQGRPFATPDEGRYVEIPREMMLSGDWITPRLNGVKYFEKPPLFYWLEAATISVFGINEGILRIWPVLFALAGCLLVYRAAREWFTPTAGVFATLILAANLLYFGVSQLIILDMAVTFFITAALLSFLTAIQAFAPFRRRLLFYTCYALMALGFLTKGLIGLALPGIVMVTWLFLARQWNYLRPFYPWTGALIFFSIAAPWPLLATLKNPEFFNFFFIHEHFERYLTTIHNRFQPWWFFPVVLVGGFFPWSLLTPHAFYYHWRETKKDPSQRHIVLFLMLWGILIFAFYMFSNSQLIPYLVPVLPPLSLLIGGYLAHLWEKASALDSYKIISNFSYSCFYGIGIVSILLISALIIYIPQEPRVDHNLLAPQILSVLILLGMISLFTFVIHRLPRLSIVGLCMSMVAFVSVGASTIPFFQRPSIKPIAHFIKTLPTARVISYQRYYQDLPAYLEQHPITVVNWKGELEFGTTVEDTSSWMINTSQFWLIWEEEKPVYVILRQDDLDQLRTEKPLLKYKLLYSYRGNVLISNLD